MITSPVNELIYRDSRTRVNEQRLWLRALSVLERDLIYTVDFVELLSLNRNDRRTNLHRTVGTSILRIATGVCWCFEFLKNHDQPGSGTYALVPNTRSTSRLLVFLLDEKREKPKVRNKLLFFSHAKLTTRWYRIRGTLDVE
jgi:hypothetical protein